MTGITWGTHPGEDGEPVATLFCCHCREVFARDLTTTDARYLKSEMVEDATHICPKEVQP